MRLRRKDIMNIIQILLILVLVMSVLMPFYWTFKISISPEKEIRTRPIKWGVSEPNLKNYRDILFSSSKTIGTAYTFRKGLINSLIVSVITTVLTVFFGSLGAYSIARLKVKFGNAMTFFVLLTQMLPPVLLIIPLYFIANQFKLLNTKLLLVICYVALNLPLCIWIMRGYFLTLPSAIEESALIDGCDKLGAFFRIVLPLSGPALFTAGLFVFNASWNEFLFALTFTTDIKAKTMTVAMAEMIGRFRTDYGLMATSGILGSILPLVFVAFFQKYLVSGITGGAVKQ